MKKSANVIMFGILVLGVMGCSSSHESDPSYVSAEQYNTYTCPQIRAEMKRLSSKVEQSLEHKERMEREKASSLAAKTLDTALNAFALYQGIGWSSGGTDDSTIAKRYQYQYEILEKLSVQKHCFEEK